MFEILRQLFSPESLAPHGMCLTWRPELIYAHVVSDTLIGAAYFSIPLALGAFVIKRRDVTFGWVFWCFALFILACGATHVFSIWTLWNPDYGVQAVLKGFTALASLATAAILWPLLPAAIALPSPAQLKSANASLEARIAERDAALAALRREIAEREKAEAALRQSQKLEAIGQLTGGVAHDFNNLLAAALSSLTLLRKRLPENDERAQRLAANAVTACERGAALTHRLLAFSRRQELNPQSVELAALVAGMEDLLHRSLGPMNRLETDLPADLPPVRADVNQLELAVLNLAVNARDAMPDGGRLAITGAAEIVGEADARGLAPGRYVRLSVRDEGVGMDAQTLARVTEPFFTTKEVGKGTGLGLSMVHGLAAQSGGALVLASAPGEGTDAQIWLPAAERDGDGEPKAVRGTAPLPAPLPAPTPRRVLVVDDDPLVLASVVDMLIDLGHTVLSASSGAEALARLDESGDVDLVLSDLAMPGMTGVELAERLRRRDPRPKVLLMTGFGDVAGRFPRLAKPFAEEELARALAALEAR
ncbi:response regulator [Salinarimonas sp.]|uniref:response regulator n=1 Tax=Salinarimonas sp. TaxID=2766526 RepID=UPI0032D9A0F0